ncbi:homeobox protein vex1-like [Argopecten irradians]|uniref:homeobox protein vex1-like n=1 Tax=Argopecten irradians TaxID=31199 RepID=UPI0037177974
MATTCTNNKKMSFSIENLAKSSREEERHDDQSYGAYIVNGNPWQQNDFASMGNVANVPYSSPYYTQNGHTSPWIPQVQFNSPLRDLKDSFRLIPDEGYSSQNNTPSLAGSGKKCSRISSDDVNRQKNSWSVNSGSGLKRKRTDVTKPENRRISEVQKHIESLTDADSSFESTCGTSDSDEGIGDTPRHKKARTAFSDDQVRALEVRYKSQKYLPAGERSKLATELGLTDQQVKTWFQNRRMKEKRKHKDDSFRGGLALPTGGVDISQLQALGIPCPPPYTVNNKHQQMMRDDSIPNFPSPSPLSPMPRTSPPTSLYSRFRPDNSMGSVLTSNQIDTYS